MTIFIHCDVEHDKDHQCISRSFERVDILREHDKDHQCISRSFERVDILRERDRLECKAWWGGGQATWWFSGKRGTVATTG